MSTALYGLGTALPVHRGSQHETFAFMNRVYAHDRKATQFLERIYLHSGIDYRYSVLQDYLKDDPESFVFFSKNWRLEPFPTTQARMKIYEHESVELAVAASEAAIKQAGVHATDLTHLVITTCTGFFAPGPDIILQKRLQLRPGIKRTLIGFMGCYAGFNGMRTADEIIRGNPKAIVLQISVELCSLHFQKDSDPDCLVSNSIFSDGCAAAIFAKAHPSKTPLATILGSASFVEENSLSQMQWHIGNHGFKMRLGAEVPTTLELHANNFLQSLLGETGISRKEVAGWAIHPGGKRIIEALQRALELKNQDVESSYQVLKDYGNMSSATIFFVIKEELKKQKKGPILAVGFGPGLTLESTALLLP